MTGIPAIPELSHLTVEDLEEVRRLLHIVFGRAQDPTAAAEQWLKDRSEVFSMTPMEMLNRDELGVRRVISFLKHAARNSAP